MRKALMITGIASGFLMLASGAEALVGTTQRLDGVVPSLTTPAAMCGRTCRSGGRYIPGPPEVCYEQGLEYCGSSRGGGGPPGPSVVVPLPGGGGIGIYGGGPPPPRCRTITIQDDWGRVRTVRRCD